MRNNRGFGLGHKLVKVFQWKIPKKSKPITFQRRNPQNSTIKAVSKLCNWGRSLKGLCFLKPGYIRVGRDPIEAKTADVPKGHLAVYVGEKEDDNQRYLVPVIYFNHPLFGDLLKEAEKEFGFNHSGVIQIPCRVSEFEKVRTIIAAAAGGGGDRRRWPVWRPR